MEPIRLACSQAEGGYFGMENLEPRVGTRVKAKDRCQYPIS